MKVLGVYSIKGGVGKTAAAVNLSYLSCRDGARTLMWDLDPQSSATFYLRIQPKIRGGGSKLIKKKGDLHGSIRGTDYPSFDLLPADFSYRKLDLTLSDVEKAEKRLRRIVKSLSGDYDHLVLDCAPGMSLLSEGVFRVADLLVVPTIPSPLSLRTLEQIRSYFDKKGLDSAKVRPFLSMVDRRRSLHRSVSDSAPADRPFRFFETGIPYSSLVEQMGVERAPLHVYSPYCSPSRSFRSLWGEIREALTASSD